MDPHKVLQKYYDKDSFTYRVLLRHSEQVRDKALYLASTVPHLRPDLRFIEEASLLHDIGIGKVNAPQLECYGKLPYIMHMVTGREILEQEGLPKHALVCERHTAFYLTPEIIESQGLPLPSRDMRPQSIEETIICFADKFFTKVPERMEIERTVPEVHAMLQSFHPNEMREFNKWCDVFGVDYR